MEGLIVVVFAVATLVAGGWHAKDRGEKERLDEYTRVRNNERFHLRGTCTCPPDPYLVEYSRGPCAGTGQTRPSPPPTLRGRGVSN